MELRNPEILAHTESPAPALLRGIAVLQLLNQQTAASLETLANQLEIPKASLARILDTLETAGVVARFPDKQYRPLWSLEPLEAGPAAYRRLIQGRMPELCELTGCTAEWYEVTEGGLRLVLQHLPDSELCVKAKPGFIRTWKTEFEAVTRVGHAFCSRAPDISSIPIYLKDGELGRIHTRKIRELIAATRIEKATYDEFFNSNGVRRFAAAALDEKTKQLRGILALAEAYNFGKQPNPTTKLEHLKRTLSS
tara:strand:- start:4966 stop:5721 length:756 start_codon:yes stop_codon:yes gene_type:complete